MTRSLHFFSLIILPFIGFSQGEYIFIKGSVYDSKTKLPLPYVSVGIPGSSIGTVANISGEFELFVPATLGKDSLFISSLGYKTFRGHLSDLNGNQKFYLHEKPIILTEVTLRGEGAKKILQLAFAAIPEVCPAGPYLMEGFHRSWEKIDFTDSIRYPGTLIEAAVTIYDPGPVKKKNGLSRERIFISEVKRSCLMAGWNYDGSILRQLLSDNVVRYNKSPFQFFGKTFFDFNRDLTFNWEGTTELDGEDVNIVKVDIPNARNFPAFYKVYVSGRDHAILRFELSGAKPNPDMALPWNMERVSQIYIFKRYQGKIYLSYAKMEYTTRKVDVLKKRVERTEDYFRELLITKLMLDGVEDKRLKLGVESKKSSIALQAKTYNEEFWKNYNVILENPLDRHVASWFEECERFKASPKKKTTGKSQVGRP